MPVLAGMEELFRSGSIDQKRSSVNWPLAKVLQRHGDAETGFKVMDAATAAPVRVSEAGRRRMNQRPVRWTSRGL